MTNIEKISAALAWVGQPLVPAEMCRIVTEGRNALTEVERDLEELRSFNFNSQHAMKIDREEYALERQRNEDAAAVDAEKFRELDQKLAAARALIEKAADVTWGFRSTKEYPVTGALHAELRAFLQTTTPESPGNVPEAARFLTYMAPDERREFVDRFNSLTGDEATRLVAEAQSICVECGHPNHESKMHQNVCTFYVPQSGAECGCSAMPHGKDKPATCPTCHGLRDNCPECAPGASAPRARTAADVSREFGIPLPTREQQEQALDEECGITPAPQGCGCAAKVALKSIAGYGNPACEYCCSTERTVLSAISTPCDCAGLRETISHLSKSYLNATSVSQQGESMQQLRAELSAREQALTSANNSLGFLHGVIEKNNAAYRSEIAGLRDELSVALHSIWTGEVMVRELRSEIATSKAYADAEHYRAEGLKADLAAMTADRDRWKAKHESYANEVWGAIKPAFDDQPEDGENDWIPTIIKRVVADLAAALEREQALKDQVKHIVDGVAQAARVVAAFDARKEGK